jgi:hypothetical protein
VVRDLLSLNEPILGNLHLSLTKIGIGTLLVEDGLRKADEAGLQTVLGASPFGIGLYRRYGFVDYETMDIKLWEYEGGKGMGTARHVIMNRPAVTQSNWV